MLDVTSARTLQTIVSSSARTFVATGLQAIGSIQLSVPSLSRMLRLGSLAFSRSRTTQVLTLRVTGRSTSSRSSARLQLRHPAPLLQARLRQLHFLPIHPHQSQYHRLHRQVTDTRQAWHPRLHHQITDPHQARYPRLHYQITDPRQAGHPQPHRQVTDTHQTRHPRLHRHQVQHTRLHRQFTDLHQARHPH